MTPFLALLFVATATDPTTAVDIDGLFEGFAVQAESLKTTFQSGEFRVQSRVRELDGDGEVKTERVSIDVVEQVDGKPKGRLVSATENGEDVTERVREERAERREKAEEKAKEKAENEGSRHAEFPNPFAPEVKEQYAFEVLGPSRARPEALRIAFRPKNKPSKELFRGVAVVDPIARRLLVLSASPSKYPTGLDEMLLTVVFGRSGEREIVRRIKGEGKGGLLFIKKHFQFHSEFGEWSFPGAPPGG